MDSTSSWFRKIDYPAKNFSPSRFSLAAAARKIYFTAKQSQFHQKLSVRMFPLSAFCFPL
jgi:hypothetical protein